MKDSISVDRFVTYIVLYVAFSLAMFLFVNGLFGLFGTPNIYSFMVAGSYSIICYCTLVIWLLNKLDGFR